MGFAPVTADNVVVLGLGTTAFILTALHARRVWPPLSMWGPLVTGLLWVLVALGLAATYGVESARSDYPLVAVLLLCALAVAASAVIAGPALVAQALAVIEKERDRSEP